MPKELLELIKALNAYKEQEQKEIQDDISMHEFIAMMDKAFKEGTTKSKCCKGPEQKPAPNPAFNFSQQVGSYKIISLDGTISALEISSTDLVQVSKDEIELVWPHTRIRFTTRPNEGCSSVSQEEFIKLAEFCLQ